VVARNTSLAFLGQPCIAAPPPLFLAAAGGSPTREAARPRSRSHEAASRIALTSRVRGRPRNKMLPLEGKWVKLQRDLAEYFAGKKKLVPPIYINPWSFPPPPPCSRMSVELRMSPRLHDWWM
jgi:hypothetical protein